MLAAYMPGRRLHRYKDDFDGMFCVVGEGVIFCPLSDWDQTG